MIVTVVIVIVIVTVVIVIVGVIVVIVIVIVTVVTVIVMVKVVIVIVIVTVVIVIVIVTVAAVIVIIAPLTETYELTTAIDGFQATASTYNTTTGTNVVFTVWMTKGSNVNVTLIYQDGTVDSDLYPGDWTNGAQQTYTHAFQDGGRFFVEVRYSVLERERERGEREGERGREGEGEREGGQLDQRSAADLHPCLSGWWPLLCRGAVFCVRERERERGGWEGGGEGGRVGREGESKRGRLDQSTPTPFRMVAASLSRCGILC